MFDIRWIRDHSRAFDEALKKRKEYPCTQYLLELDKKLRQCITHLQNYQERRKIVAKQVGDAKKKGLDASDLMQEGEFLKEHISVLEQQSHQLDHLLKTELSKIPNLPDPSCPIGLNENDNKIIETVGNPRFFDFEPRHHYDIGESLGGMDFELGARLCGSRFVFLKHHLAMLERALAHFMVDTHIDHGYMEISPPLLVREHAVFGTGQLPKQEEDQFKTTTDHYLIPTSEVVLTNIVRDTIIHEQELPLRFVAHTPCFRKEAGAAGKDTRGMIRLHQFSKVELVSITTPDQSNAEHERMVTCARRILDLLELPYRVVLLCTGDMGFCSQKTYDLEVWLPAQHAYREISSCSNCGEFQARRMNARYRDQTFQKNSLVHTLNGSGIAVGRALVAVLENYQNADGSIMIPPVLVNYMRGMTTILPIH